MKKNIDAGALAGQIAGLMVELTNGEALKTFAAGSKIGERRGMMAAYSGILKGIDPERYANLMPVILARGVR